MSEMKKDGAPGRIWQEYETGRRFKSGIGQLGMYDQNRRNERFFVGDQWHGAKTGGERPLVRHNVIKRIGDYKMAMIGSAPIAVNFSADGVPSTVALREEAQKTREAMAAGMEISGEMPSNQKIQLVMSALSDYFDVTARRVNMDDLKMQALKDAYISGTTFLHTYWDPDVETGLYADETQETAIVGDIRTELLDVENVYLGDPNTAEVQSQPYILIVQRKSVKELRAIAKRHGVSEAEREEIRPDTELSYMAGDRSQEEPYESRKATVITRLWKRKSKDGRRTVKAIQVCKGVVIRPEWDLGVRLYPLAMFCWESRKGCAYGDSEVTYLIPNQIAINRSITASVWAVMMMGIPMTVVNGDVVQEPVTNDPGQVLRVYGSAEEVASAIRYVNPPNFSPQFDQNINSLINNTLVQCGANDAALGNVRPDNTSAIVAVREAATLPMQPVQNRFYNFIAQIARIWAEFWVMKYGTRSLKIEDDNGVWYMPFNGDDYKKLIISVKIDVGAAGLWSEAQATTTLGNLLDRQVITPLQYMQGIPKGTIPNQQKIISDMQKKEQAAAQPDLQSTASHEMVPTDDPSGILSALPEEYRRQLAALPEEQAQQLISKVIGAQGPSA